MTRKNPLQLHPREENVLRFFAEYQARHRRSPTLEIAAAGLRMSRSTIHRDLESLVEAGLMCHRPGRHRPYFVRVGVGNPVPSG